MDKNKVLIIGIIVTIIIDYIATLYGGMLNVKVDFIPHSFGTHSTMLLLSILAIILFRKYVNYRISVPTFKKVLKPVVFGFFASAFMNMVMMSIIASTKGSDSVAIQMPTSDLSIFQIIVFVFIYASIAEEMLFRGFLLNILSPLKDKGITFLNRKLSLPVVISAILFGVSHLILLSPDRNNVFVYGIVISASVLGIIAGYYQEKYENNAYAVLVHMAGNLVAVIGTIGMNVTS